MVLPKKCSAYTVKIDRYKPLKNMTDIKQNTTRNMTPMNEDLAVLRKHFPQCITFYCRNQRHR
jgi:hypothetical protein